MTDGRELIARLVLEEGRLELRCPGVGLWREAPARGSLVFPGSLVGRLEVLGILHPLRAPEGTHGLVIGHGGEEGRARRPLGFDDLLLELDPEVAAADAAFETEVERQSQTSGLVFRAPSSGRFYARPAPDKSPFVSLGEVVSAGQIVAILEVMKTFNRIPYGGERLPPKARVVRILPRDGDDLGSGDAIFELEPVEE
jgi:acetyl-CoA carboxylase biotin carboxyl carrier protein